MADESKLPSGRLGRLVRLAELGARTGTSLLLRRESDDAATRAAEILGNLRGVAAKVGQMAGYIDGLVPEEHRDAYQKSMKTLLAAAPRSSPAQIRRVVEEELGAPIDRLFSSFGGRGRRERLHRPGSPRGSSEWNRGRREGAAPGRREGRRERPRERGALGGRALDDGHAQARFEGGARGDQGTLPRGARLHDRSAAPDASLPACTRATRRS